MKISKIIDKRTYAAYFIILVFCMIFIIIQNKNIDKHLYELKIVQEKLLKHQRNQNVTFPSESKADDGTQIEYSIDTLVSTLTNNVKHIIKQELATLDGKSGVSIVQRVTGDEGSTVQDKSLENKSSHWFESQQILSDSINSGSWTTESSMKMRENFQTLTYKEQTDITVKLLKAINRGDIIPENPEDVIF